MFVHVGAWPTQPDNGNLINSSDLSWSRDVFAVGDELGYIRLFRFPCSQPGVSSMKSEGIGRDSVNVQVGVCSAGTLKPLLYTRPCSASFCKTTLDIENPYPF